MKNIVHGKLQEKLKRKMLDTACQTNSRHVHIGSCLSAFDIIFYVNLIAMKPQDKFILSKGHAALALYVILNHQKKIPDSALTNYLKSGGELGIHPPILFPEAIPLATGSLGHGLSFACGLSKGYLLQKIKPLPQVYCLLSDGECNEGSVWEAALFASRHHLSNLIVVIDKNGFQAFGRTKDVLGIATSADKWKAFGFKVFECDGHDLSALEKTFYQAKKGRYNKPTVIICDTIRGKGIKLLENKLSSNYTLVSHYEI